MVPPRFLLILCVALNDWRYAVVTLVSVAEISGYLKELFAIDPVLGDLWVRGEVTNVSRPASGHLYFTLRDETASLRAVSFKQQARYLDHSPRDGDAVLAHGRVGVYEANGTYQLYVDAVQPEGAGLAAAILARLRTQLQQEGLFDESRKRPLPDAPAVVGVVTSESGAVWHDIQTVIARRYPMTRLVLAPAAVQGAHAPDEIVRALRQIEADGQAQVVIVGRGGGSAEDLAAFNDERVVRAIFACRLPTVSAVGHETDLTLADLVADVRAPTPSAAAELVTPDTREVRRDLQVAERLLAGLAMRQIEEGRGDVDDARASLARHSPLHRVTALRQRTDDHAASLGAALTRRLAGERARLDARGAALEALDPRAVLRRGYALVTDAATGDVVRSAVGMRAGQRVRVRVADGAFAATVAETTSGATADTTREERAR